jgi:hypothetical protein
MQEVLKRFVITRMTIQSNGRPAYTFVPRREYYFPSTTPTQADVTNSVAHDEFDLSLFNTEPFDILEMEPLELSSFDAERLDFSEIDIEREVVNSVIPDLESFQKSVKTQSTVPPK